MTQLETKTQALDQLLSDLGSVVVAYSGGVDSTMVAARAHQVLGSAALVVTAISPALARRDLDLARSIAAERGWNHRTVETGEIDRDEYARNDPDRCFWCKTSLFETLGPIAAERSAVVVTGTNADDLGDYRPGLRAAADHDVRAPLAEIGLTKEEVRALSREMGLPTAEKPASPCLASRFAYGVRVTEQGLRRIETAEEIVRTYGFSDLRVRDHGDLARIEVPAPEVPRAIEVHEELGAQLRELGFKFVTLDLGGLKSGSLNAALPLPTLRMPSPATPYRE